MKINDSCKRINIKGPAVSLAVSVIVMLALQLLFEARFEQNDDAGMLSIASGLRGSFDSHLVYVSPILGRLLAGLYEMTRSVPWYTLVQTFAVLAGITALTWLTLNKLEGRMGICIALAINLVMSYECHIRMQFTKTTGLLAVASIGMLIYAVSEEEINRREIVAGELLAMAGMLIRYKQFLSIGVLMLPLGLYYLFRLKGRSGRDLARRIGAAAAAALIAGAMLLGVGAVKKAAYSSDEWQSFMEFNRGRSGFLDYGVPPYEDMKESLAGSGVDETTFSLIAGWNYGDTERVTTETWKLLSDARGSRALDSGFVISFARKAIRSVPAKSSFVMFAGVFVCWLLLARKRKSQYLIALAEAAAVLLTYMYMFYLSRMDCNRVEVGIWLAATMVLVLSCEGDAFEGGRSGSDTASRRSLYGGIALLAVTVAAGGIMWSDNLRINASGPASAASESAREVIEYMVEHRDICFVAKSGCVSFSTAYGPWDAVPKDAAVNYCSLGGWTSELPMSRENARRFGITNPYRDMIGRDDVLLIDNNIGLTMRYIRKFYDPAATYEIADKVGGKTVYRIKAGS